MNLALLLFTLVTALLLIVAQRKGLGYLRWDAGMATLSVENSVRMWQKVDQSLAALEASFVAKEQFKALKSWIMQDYQGLQLQLKKIADLTVDVNPLDGAIQVYAIYLKKQNTATDAYFKLFDDATDDTTADDARFGVALLEANDEAVLIFPKGIPLAAGSVIGSYTAFTGYNNTTPSTSGDGPNGFVLYGA